MVMNNKKEKLECPTIEDLSAYFDNELDSCVDYSEHIKTCSNCRATLKSYEEIKKHIKADLTIEAPTELSKKVIKSIERYKKANNPTQSISYTKILKFAAMIAIIAFSILLLIPKDEKRSNKISPGINSLAFSTNCK